MAGWLGGDGGAAPAAAGAQRGPAAAGEPAPGTGAAVFFAHSVRSVGPAAPAGRPAVLALPAPHGEGAAASAAAAAPADMLLVSNALAALEITALVIPSEPLGAGCGMS